MGMNLRSIAVLHQRQFLQQQFTLLSATRSLHSSRKHALRSVLRVEPCLSQCKSGSPLSEQLSRRGHSASLQLHRIGGRSFEQHRISSTPSKPTLQRDGYGVCRAAFSTSLEEEVAEREGGAPSAAAGALADAAVDAERSTDEAAAGGKGEADGAAPPGPKKLLGAFQQLPMVPPAYEIIGSAIRKAKMVRPTKGILNAAKRERNKGAKQIDALTKELATPLSTYVKRCPSRQKLHAYEQSLLELSFEEGVYENTLLRVDKLRKKILDVGKNQASLVAKATTKKEAEDLCAEGYTKLEELYNRNGSAVDELKEVVKTLRAMPVVDVKMPTLCLVGAPNVGKSSLVRVLSSGKPEVCNYPFTTKGISMGHFDVSDRKYQVTDTPGLLFRPDDERNRMERLTLAALTHLPTAVLFVHDLTGECGTSVADQYKLYCELKERYKQRPWLDAVSKADLLPPCPPPPPRVEEPAADMAASEDNAADVAALEEYAQRGPPDALWVSIHTRQGLDELVKLVHEMLGARDLGEGWVHVEEDSAGVDA